MNPVSSASGRHPIRQGVPSTRAAQAFGPSSNTLRQQVRDRTILPLSWGPTRSTGGAAASVCDDVRSVTHDRQGLKKVQLALLLAMRSALRLGGP